MYWLIAPFSWSFDDVGLTYFIPPHLQNQIKIWDIVFIPSKKDEITIGVVMNIMTEFSWDFAQDKLKSIIDIASKDFSLFSYQTKIIQWMSSYYFTLIHNCTSLFIPSNLRKKLETWKVKHKEKVYSYKNNLIALTEKQEKVYESIKNSQHNKILLWGITGSWKTEIYKKLIGDYLAIWKQVLILIPEIVVWYELGERYKKSFWNDVIIINSTVSEAKKTELWLDVFSGEAKIIVWTRSSLFYPFSNLGLIIIDEEHDSSYNSDKSPRYKSIEIAEKISEICNIKLILASWTPSVESIYKANKGKYQLFSLLEKYKK